MQIGHREKKIIESLLKNPRSFLTIHHIAQDLGVSSRTIHRELVFVESTLNHFNLTLERLPNKGLRIIGDAEQFDALIEQLEASQVIDLSVEERQVIILYTLIKSKDPVKQYNLANETGISINKLTKELTLLEADLSRYHLAIQKKRGEGLLLVGNELNKRQLLADMMLDQLNSTSVYSVIEDHFVYQTLNDKQLADLVDMNQIFNVERLLMDELSALPYILMETAYLTLTIHIVLAIERIKNGERVKIDDDIVNALRVTPEFKVAEDLCLSLERAYHVKFDLEEKVFITMHLRGAKRRTDESEASMDLSTLTHELIHEVSERSGRDFSDNPVLFEGIQLHLGPALNRISGGIETYNPLTDMIKADYAPLFHAVQSALETVCPDAHFPDGEIAFIVLHFGGAVKASTQADVLVVCTSGIGTSRILSNQIEQLFPHVNVVRQASVSELKHIDLVQFDHIISTVGLDIPYPYTVINPLLPDSDRAVLSQIFQSPVTRSAPVQPVSSTADYHDIVTFVTEGDQLINAIHCTTANARSLAEVVQLLPDETISPDFIHALTQREQVQGFAMTDTAIAIPHIVDPSVRHPFIHLIRLEEPLQLMNMENELQDVTYIAMMGLPDDTHIRTLMSEFSLLLMEHVDSPDTLFNNQAFVVQHMQQCLLQQLTKQIY